MDEYIKRDNVLALATPVPGCFSSMIPSWDVVHMPAEDVEPVQHGWWQQTEDGGWECTNCKNEVTICVCGKDRTYRMERCPHCGARMGGGKKFGEELNQ